MTYEGKVVLNYKLTRKLGEGGFGAVYLAEQVDLGRRAAIKILHHQFASQPAVVERFFQEARAVCAINHRAIVAIENFGRLPETDEPFYLMEFFPGGSLTQIAGERWLTSEQLVAILDPIADALTAAHTKGIIHRDLKPDNIMVRIADDKVVDVRLLDFGIAKLLDGQSHSMTGSAMGTPSYMPPEQALDAKNVDVRADVYSFGATIYAAVAGRPPFDGSSVAAILLAVQQQTAALLPTIRPDVTLELDAAIRRCLAKQRDHRPPTIADAWGAIRGELVRAHLSSNPAPPNPAYANVDTPPPMGVVTPMPAAPPPVATPVPGTIKAIDVALATTPEVRRKSRAPLAIGIVGLVAVFGIVVAVVASSSGGSGGKTSGSQLAISDDVAKTVAVDAAPVATTRPDVAEAKTLPTLVEADVEDVFTKAARDKLPPCGVDLKSKTMSVLFRIDVDAAGTLASIKIDGPTTAAADCIRTYLEKTAIGIRASRSGGAFAVRLDLPTGKVRPKPPDPGPKPPDRPEPPAENCSEGAFMAIANGTPTEPQVTAALKRLERCKIANKLDESAIARIKQALVAKL